jgi:hypothetical protein
METIINILIVVSMAAVLVSLGLGLFSLAKGGDYSRDNSNKFMRWRVASQALAIVFLTIGFLYKATH